MTAAPLIRETDPTNLDWDMNRMWRALVLAPTLETWQALLAGEHVPLSALDPLWVKRLGLK